ncbi:MAG: hypothetical protein OEY88_05585 [Candidatus Bathyarchaeota archaeon]|nr:hypothetical protein [Candidatus Bathyarchaeota archaeon]
MERNARSKWIVISLMAVVLPIGILLGFKLARIIPEPLEPENIIAEDVSLNMSRPSDTMSFVGMIATNHFSDDATSVRSKVHVSTYLENNEGFHDRMLFAVNATAQLQKGFIHSMFIRLSGMDPDASLYISISDLWPRMQNLKTESIAAYGTENREAYIRATGFDHPTSCSLEIVITWRFLDGDKNNEDHYVTVTLETLYYDGSAYKQIIIPVTVNMTIDPGDTFETAKYLLWDGVYSETLDEKDKIDIYAIPFRRDGSTIKINLTVPQNAEFALRLYDDEKVEVANSTYGVGINEVISYTDQTLRDAEPDHNPWWFIEVERVTGSGTYKLEVHRMGKGK